MGSGLMSTLQGIGSTGNEIGAGAIASQQQSHQFLMDYLARQAQTRGLDIAQSGQEQVGRIAAGQQDIERQRIAQSRWQIMPGFTRIPHPTDPTKTQFRTTLLDPVTNQRVFHDVDQPPPGSPEYIMNGYNYADKFAKQAGIVLSPGQKLAFGGMKVDTPEDNNQKYATLYDIIAADPDGLKYLKDHYKGGKGQFIDEHVKNSLIGYSREDQLKMIRDFAAEGKTATGQNVGPSAADKMYEESLLQGQKAYTTIQKNANDTIVKLGLIGEHTRPDEYKAAVTTRDDATKNLDDINRNLTQYYTRTRPSTTTPTSPPPTHINPPVPHPADGQTATGPNGHKIIIKGGQWVDAITGQPIGSSGSSQ